MSTFVKRGNIGFTPSQVSGFNKQTPKTDKQTNLKGEK